MQREIEPFDLHLLADRQADDDVDGLEDDQRRDGGPAQPSLRPATYCDESSVVPVRRVGCKCVETKALRSRSGLRLRPLGGRRSKAAQDCTIFSQELRGEFPRATGSRRPMCYAPAPGALKSLGDTSAGATALGQRDEGLMRRSEARRIRCRLGRVLHCKASPCWLRSRPSISCCALTRSGRNNSIALSRT